MQHITAFLVMGMVFISGCSSAKDNGNNGSQANTVEDITVEATGDVAVDISDFGMRGQMFSGVAVLSGHPLVLDEFDNPPLEYRDEPAVLRVHLSGQVLNHAPGQVEVQLTSLSPRFTENERALGTANSEELLRRLAENGVFFPEATTANPMEVTFTITASDEDYSEIYLTADADFFQLFESRQ